MAVAGHGGFGGARPWRLCSERERERRSAMEAMSREKERERWSAMMVVAD